MDRSSPAYDESARDLPENPTHGSGWIVQALPTTKAHATFSRIPPTAVSRSFKPCLRQKRTRPSRESHPRQWVDRSSPAYDESARDLPENPTHGSGWIVQALPTMISERDLPENPTHGSGWIVQALPNCRDSGMTSPKRWSQSRWSRRKPMVAKAGSLQPAP